MKKAIAAALLLLFALVCFAGCSSSEPVYEIGGVSWQYQSVSGGASIYPAYEKIGSRIRKYRTPLGGEIRIPGEIDGKTVVEIEESAFSDCREITSLQIPESVTKIGADAFYGCTELSAVSLPDSLKYIGANAFYETKVKSLLIPAQVRSFGENDTETFYGCLTLREIIVSSENPNYLSENGVLFSRNKKTLICYPAAKTGTTYEIPDTVETIAAGAFTQNPYLEELRVPQSVRKVNDAFYGCSALRTVFVSERRAAEYEEKGFFSAVEMKTQANGG